MVEVSRFFIEEEKNSVNFESFLVFVGIFRFVFRICKCGVGVNRIGGCCFI